MKVTVLPYIAPRRRRHEATVSIVKWTDGTMVYFRHYKRDSAAVAFLNTLIEQGFKATVQMVKA